MKILITGAAGFIGAAVVKRLAELSLYGGDIRYPEYRQLSVIALDNINDYYSQELKFARIRELGIELDITSGTEFVDSVKYPSLKFIKQDICDVEAMSRLFEECEFDFVINLAAQAGVRYSIENPAAYIRSNIDGFINILEGCRNTNVRHLVYASSSSVYGLNGKVPFSEKDSTAHPVSLYAATKKSDELMAHAYSQLYGLPTTGLRFFTVYGPWGRPDMSPFLFIDAILNGRPIKVFNHGDMMRDFTYIDDIVESIIRILPIIPDGVPDWNNLEPDPSTSSAPFRIYNIGNSSPTGLMDYIRCIENESGIKAKIEFMPMQPGDVYKTYADSSALYDTIGFKPATRLSDGIAETIRWYRQYCLHRQQ